MKKFMHALSLLVLLSAGSVLGMEKAGKKWLDMSDYYWRNIFEFHGNKYDSSLFLVGKAFTNHYDFYLGQRRVKVRFGEKLFKKENKDLLNDALKTLKDKLGNNGKIDLDCMDTAITDNQLKIITEKFKDNLCGLNLGWCGNITDAGLAHLKGLKNLESLNLRRCNNITDEGLEFISENFKNLQSLNLSGCRQITDAGVRHLKGLTNLRSLDFYQTRRKTP